MKNDYSSKHYDYLEILNKIFFNNFELKGYGYPQRGDWNSSESFSDLLQLKLKRNYLFQDLKTIDPPQNRNLIIETSSIEEQAHFINVALSGKLKNGKIH